MPECQLTIKAVPNAARSEIVGWVGDALKIRLKAPPVDGKANAELCRFLAGFFNLPKPAITLATGDTARLKRVHIQGLTTADVAAQLPQKGSGR